MKKSPISSSVLKKIKKEKIEQHSKLYFFTKFALFLLGGIIFFIIGIIATAVIWHFFHDMELFEIFSIKRMLFFKALLLGFPIFWLLISVLLGISVSYFAINTKKGYKISYKIWIALVILAQIAGGLALEQSPLGKHLEHNMLREIHIFKSREKNFQELWQNPEQGMLIGEILNLEKERLILIDFKDNEWIVSFSKESIHTKNELKPLDKIRVLGHKTGEFEFFAKRIVGRRFNPEGERRPHLKKGFMKKRINNLPPPKDFPEFRKRPTNF